jgi:hypothetical protein
MNPRERMLAMGVLLVVVLAGGLFLFHRLFLVPLEERDQNIARLEQEVQTKRDHIQEVIAQFPKLERARQLSLPANADLAKREYARYLNELMRDSGFGQGTFSITPPRDVDSKTAPTVGNKGPVYKKLTFGVQAHSTLGNLVTMLEKFYETSLLQEIKKITISRPLTAGPQQQQQQNDLDINLTIEALIVTGAEDRPYLKPGVDRRLLLIDTVTAMRGGPAGLALVPWVPGPTGRFGPQVLARSEGQYAAIAEKNVFLGPVLGQRLEDVLVSQFVYLTDITQNERRSEAWLYNRLTESRTRLRSEKGFDSFRVVDEKGETVLRGKVVRIDPRDLVFKVDQNENYYSIHVGQTLEEAMKAPLTSEQRKTMGFVLTDEEKKTVKNP